jgi:type II secretory pathway component PulM
MKHIAKGFLLGIGALLASAVGWLLLLWIGPLRRRVFHDVDSLSSNGKTLLVTFLIALCLVLVGLLIWSQLAYSRFRMKVYEKKVTEDDLRPEEMKKAMETILEMERKLHPKMTFLDWVTNWLVK